MMNRDLFKSDTNKARNLGATLARFGKYFGKFWYVLVLALVLIVILIWM